MSLTREQIENWRKIVLSHWAADENGKWLEHAESKRQANALCDMALSALPAGHVAVPRELTEAMGYAGVQCAFYDLEVRLTWKQCESLYKEMIAAAEGKK